MKAQRDRERATSTLDDWRAQGDGEEGHGRRIIRREYEILGTQQVLKKMRMKKENALEKDTRTQRFV